MGMSASEAVDGWSIYVLRSLLNSLEALDSELGGDSGGPLDVSLDLYQMEGDS